MKYAFELGHQPHISRAEIEIVLKEMYKIDFSVPKQIPLFFIIETKESLDAVKLMQRLGGTISINEYIAPAKKTAETIASILEKENGKIHFSIKSEDKKMGLAIKKELKARGKSVRYVEPKNTATIIHNGLIKSRSNFIVVDNEIYVTVGVQDIEEFTRRDYGRPKMDDKSGMLPPKLARAMINLAGKDTDAKLLDAFCGSGTVLIEALDMGYTNVVGSDVSLKAVEDTKKNMEWFVEEQAITVSYAIHNQDASVLTKTIKEHSIDAIVSEPYLGKPLSGRETKQQIMGQTKELSELYARTFISFAKILKKDGVAVFIIPTFKYKNEWIEVNCAEQIKKAGLEIVPLSKESKTLLYHRPTQHLGRRILKLKKK